MAVPKLYVYNRRLLSGTHRRNNLGRLHTKNVFDSLDLRNSLPSLSQFKKRKNRALGYVLKNDKLEPLETYRDRTDVAPAGSIFSDILDMAKWLQLHLNKGKFGKKRLLREEIISEMHRPQMLIPSNESHEALFGTPLNSYALGWRV